VTFDSIPGAEPPDPSGALVGQILAGRYRIIAKLGEGAMGAVYLAEHLRIGRRDAIKVLRTGMARDPEAIARFTRGARNVSTIQHPNVCTIYDFSDTDDGLQFLAMEFVEGETLKDTLDREGRLDLHRAISIARQVAAALQAAHDVGIVHRDLKPGNIMLARKPDGSDAVKVVDFDIAKGPSEALGEEVTRLGFVVGTPEYMSPEQLMGERLDGRSDVYSLAIVLFRMLTGTLPFRAATTQEIMVQRLTTEPLRLEEALPAAAFPPALEGLLLHALARKASDRIASAAEFAQGLTSAISPDRTPSPTGKRAVELPPTRVVPAVRASRPPVRKPHVGVPAFLRRPAVLAGVGLVVVIAAGAFMLLRDSNSNDTGSQPTQVELSERGASMPPVQSDTAVATPIERYERPIDSSPTNDMPGGGGAMPSATRRQWDEASLEAMLDRQLETVGESPTDSLVLNAVRDSGQIGWEEAQSNHNKAAAALVLAQAALVAGNMPECGRWTRLGVRYDRAGFDVLAQACK
jgi:serine/threonine-protein kinase